ncbi:hypothetical protein [Streptomyces sp. NPDC051567]|uniref:hypothetical protein n=1 Tax=Streptomyces sp. NPDC051567 TaxID=3365660 RepID=UPI0037B09722
MTREIDTGELVAAMRTVDEVGRLFAEALAVHRARGLKRSADDFKVAGGAVQTLQGAEEMAEGARTYLTQLALVVGFATAGFEDVAARKLVLARRGFIGMGGGARMARPLLDPTLRGLRLLLTLDLFEPEFRADVEEVLHAPRATYPDPAMFRIRPSGEAVPAASPAS